MIFVTVGHQMPFDRMIRLVDTWAGQQPGADVMAQIGASDFVPRHMEYQKLLSRREFDACLQRCSAVVAHAGAGTIIQVLGCNKPLLVFPRLGRLAETRNDHQVGTARHFADQQQLLAAFTEQEFMQKLDELAQFRPARPVGPYASAELLERLRSFI